MGNIWPGLEKSITDRIEQATAGDGSVPNSATGEFRIPNWELPGPTQILDSWVGTYTLPGPMVYWKEPLMTMPLEDTLTPVQRLQNIIKNTADRVCFARNLELLKLEDMLQWEEIRVAHTLLPNFINDPEAISQLQTAITARIINAPASQQQYVENFVADYWSGEHDNISADTYKNFQDTFDFNEFIRSAVVDSMPSALWNQLKTVYDLVLKDLGQLTANDLQVLILNPVSINFLKTLASENQEQKTSFETDARFAFFDEYRKFIQTLFRLRKMVPFTIIGGPDAQITNRFLHIQCHYSLNRLLPTQESDAGPSLFTEDMAAVPVDIAGGELLAYMYYLGVLSVMVSSKSLPFADKFDMDTKDIDTLRIFRISTEQLDKWANDWVTDFFNGVLPPDTWDRITMKPFVEMLPRPLYTYLSDDGSAKDGLVQLRENPLPVLAALALYVVGTAFARHVTGSLVRTSYSYPYQLIAVISKYGSGVPENKLSEFWKSSVVNFYTTWCYGKTFVSSSVIYEVQKAVQQRARDLEMTIGPAAPFLNVADADERQQLFNQFIDTVLKFRLTSLNVGEEFVRNPVTMANSLAVLQSVSVLQLLQITDPPVQDLKFKLWYAEELLPALMRDEDAVWQKESIKLQQKYPDRLARLADVYETLDFSPMDFADLPPHYSSPKSDHSLLSYTPKSDEELRLVRYALTLNSSLTIIQWRHICSEVAIRLYFTEPMLEPLAQYCIRLALRAAPPLPVFSSEREESHRQLVDYLAHSYQLIRYPQFNTNASTDTPYDAYYTYGTASAFLALLDQRLRNRLLEETNQFLRNRVWAFEIWPEWSRYAYIPTVEYWKTRVTAAGELDAMATDVLPRLTDWQTVTPGQAMLKYALQNYESSILLEDFLSFAKDDVLIDLLSTHYNQYGYRSRLLAFCKDRIVWRFIGPAADPMEFTAAGIVDFLTKMTQNYVDRTVSTDNGVLDGYDKEWDLSALRGSFRVLFQKLAGERSSYWKTNVWPKLQEIITSRVMSYHITLASMPDYTTVMYPVQTPGQQLVRDALLRHYGPLYDMRKYTFAGPVQLAWTYVGSSTASAWFTREKEKDLEQAATDYIVGTLDINVAMPSAGKVKVFFDAFNWHLNYKMTSEDAKPNFMRGLLAVYEQQAVWGSNETLFQLISGYLQDDDLAFKSPYARSTLFQFLLTAILRELQYQKGQFGLTREVYQLIESLLFDFSHIVANYRFFYWKYHAIYLEKSSIPVPLSLPSMDGKVPESLWPQYVEETKPVPTIKILSGNTVKVQVNKSTVYEIKTDTPADSFAVENSAPWITLLPNSNTIRIGPAPSISMVTTATIRAFKGVASDETLLTITVMAPEPVEPCKDGPVIYPNPRPKYETMALKKRAKYTVKSNCEPIKETPILIGNEQIVAQTNETIEVVYSSIPFAISWSIMPDLPDGLMFNNGNLTGAVTLPQRYSGNITAVTSFGEVSKHIIIDISQQPVIRPLPRVSSQLTVESLRPDEPFSYVLQVQDADTVEVKPPANTVTYDAMDMTISGIFTEPGKFTSIVILRNESGQTVTEITFSVVQVNPPSADLLISYAPNNKVEQLVRSGALLASKTVLRAEFMGFFNRDELIRWALKSWGTLHEYLQETLSKTLIMRGFEQYSTELPAEPDEQLEDFFVKTMYERLPARLPAGYTFIAQLISDTFADTDLAQYAYSPQSENWPIVYPVFIQGIHEAENRFWILHGEAMNDAPLPGDGTNRANAYFMERANYHSSDKLARPPAEDELRELRESTAIASFLATDGTDTGLMAHVDEEIEAYYTAIMSNTVELRRVEISYMVGNAYLEVVGLYITATELQNYMKTSTITALLKDFSRPLDDRMRAEIKALIQSTKRNIADLSGEPDQEESRHDRTILVSNAGCAGVPNSKRAVVSGITIPDFTDE